MNGENSVELFEADPEDVRGSTTPGRKGKIALGQVGIRCLHCAQVNRSERSKGGVNFSHTIVIYGSSLPKSIFE